MKILIIQLRRIGDIIVTTPVIDALKEKFPDAEVDFLAEPMGEPILRGYPGLNEALIFDKRRILHWFKDIRRRRYDWVLDFMNNPRSAQMTWASGAAVRAGFEVPFWGLAYTHTVDRPAAPTYAVQSKFNLLRALGLAPSRTALPRLGLTDEDFAGARAWWDKNGLDRFKERVAVMPVHRHEIRQWPPRKFRDLLVRLIQKRDRAFLLLGSAQEEGPLRTLAKDFAERVFVVPPGPLRQAAALLARCQAAVTNDSGLMHLAVAVGTPTVTLYGPTWPGSWNPGAPPHRFLQAEGLACLGCNRDACPYGHECMEWISPEKMARVVEEALAGAAS